MKHIPNQLNIFDLPELNRDEILTEKANELLELLNDGRKDKYLPQYYFQENGYIVLIACNKANDKLFNVLDLEGNTPFGFSSNWRIFSEVQKEIKK